jgi:hypothetical protein
LCCINVVKVALEQKLAVNGADGYLLIAGARQEKCEWF